MLNHDRAVDRDRTLGRLAEIAKIGALDNGGVCRLALSEEETHARIRCLKCAESIGCESFVDPIGNLFMRWTPPGATSQRPVLVGSHLDSQPVGGNFDGVLGVIAALECIEVLAKHPGSVATPVEVAIWCNEEGARFNPTTMGSAVHAGHLQLDDALAVKAADGMAVGEALAKSLASFAASDITLAPRPLCGAYAAYVELHIEQGPILEDQGVAIGVVTDVQGLAQYRVSVDGVAGHAGAVPMERRADALSSARTLMDAIDQTLRDLHGLRYTIGRFELAPGSINTIASSASFTLDVRHPDRIVLEDAMARVEAALTNARAERLIYQTPVPFDKEITEAIAASAAKRGFSWRRMVSGAIHDAAHVAALCPSGMIFVPCRDGISHNENEFCDPEAVVQGAQVLADTVFALAARPER